MSYRHGGAVDIEMRKLRGELGLIGNNLNQLAHAAHLGDAVACGDTLQDIDRLKDRTDILLRSLRSGRPRRLRPAPLPVMH
ncbi:plasmid mobilization relaxosome protein MobC [Gluconobacter oxydans]